MPDYDYDEYTRRHEEYEAQRLLDEESGEFTGQVQDSLRNCRSGRK